MLKYALRAMFLFPERMFTMFIPVAVSVEKWDYQIVHETQQRRLLQEDPPFLDRSPKTERSTRIDMVVIHANSSDFLHDDR